MACSLRSPPMIKGQSREQTNVCYIPAKQVPRYKTETLLLASKMDLLVDSNIAHMFGPEGAAIYFARLLKADVRSLHPTMTPEWPHAFFITSPTAQQNAAPPTLYINQRPAHLLDYTIRQVGTVVPQGIWPSGNASADTPSRSGSATSLRSNLNMPIFLVGMDRVSLGLPLPFAIAEGDRAPLQGASSPAQIGSTSTTYIRITVSNPHQLSQLEGPVLSYLFGFSFSGPATASGRRR
jgi:hypothetical protein